MTKNQVFWLFRFRGSWPTKGQWKFGFTKMGSSFPTKGQWKIFFAKMGSKIPTKGQWKIFFISKRSQKGSSRPGKGPLNFFSTEITGPFPGVLLKIEKFFACGAHHRGNPQDYALTGEPRPPKKHYPLHPTFDVIFISRERLNIFQFC